MNITGVGKAMLAYLDDEYIQKYVINNLVSKTPNSYDTAEKLYKSLEDVRNLGYAVDDEEIQLGLRCIAAPIFNKNKKVVAAVSISGMVNAVSSEKTEKIAKDVMLCAANISRRLGYMG